MRQHIEHSIKKFDQNVPLPSAVTADVQSGPSIPHYTRVPAMDITWGKEDERYEIK